MPDTLRTSKPIHERGLLRPTEIARLKRVFEQACNARRIIPDSADGREIALTLLALHNAGMVDEEMLAAAVAYTPPQARSA